MHCILLEIEHWDLSVQILLSLLVVHIRLQIDHVPPIAELVCLKSVRLLNDDLLIVWQLAVQLVFAPVALHLA